MAMVALVLLDAGVRVGEALGLTWGAVAWGESKHDPRRALIIDRSRPRGGEEGFTKSGRSRRVSLSRRLRSVLLDLYEARFRPSPDALIFDGLDPKNFLRRPWRRILQRAGIGHRPMKDLRDTFASQLLTCGVSLGYVSAQLGHSDVSTTARHYARWVGGDTYRAPMQLGDGDVAADFLARLGGEWPQPDPIRRNMVSDGRDPEAESLEISGSSVVTRARFERATPSFGGWCSIQAELPGQAGRERHA